MVLYILWTGFYRFIRFLINLVRKQEHHRTTHNPQARQAVRFLWDPRNALHLTLNKCTKFCAMAYSFHGTWLLQPFGSTSGDRVRSWYCITDENLLQKATNRDCFMYLSTFIPIYLCTLWVSRAWLEWQPCANSTTLWTSFCYSSAWCQISGHKPLPEVFKSHWLRYLQGYLTTATAVQVLTLNLRLTITNSFGD
jgi:hypothetical protein